MNLGLFAGRAGLRADLHGPARRGAGAGACCVLAALALGVLGTLPIGGADMPVVISLLNAFTGTAVAMAGFVLESTPLIIAGALVGAAGAHPDQADGRRDEPLAGEHRRRRVRHRRRRRAGGAAPGGTVREASPDDAALQLAYASRVVIVPGYGLAAAQAQHELVALAQALDEHGVDVSYGIHPVAGRMPGHMNVLLSEANAPYTQLKDLEEINRVFPTTDVVLVVGANDVTNPAARRPGNAVSGMPILDVDQREVGPRDQALDGQRVRRDGQRALHQPAHRDAFRRRQGSAGEPELPRLTAYITVGPDDVMADRDAALTAYLA